MAYSYRVRVAFHSASLLYHHFTQPDWARRPGEGPELQYPHENPLPPRLAVGPWRLVLLCPAWRKYGMARTVRPSTVILHSRADDVIPFADSEELPKTRARLVEIGTVHRLADPEPLGAMSRACGRMIL